MKVRRRPSRHGVGRAAGNRRHLGFGQDIRFQGLDQASAERRRGRPKPGNPWVVFGGRHADLALDAGMGAALSWLIGTHSLACVVDLPELGSGAGRRRFMSLPRSSTALRDHRGAGHDGPAGTGRPCDTRSGAGWEPSMNEPRLPHSSARIAGRTAALRSICRYGGTKDGQPIVLK